MLVDMAMDGMDLARESVKRFKGAKKSLDWALKSLAKEAVQELRSNITSGRVTPGLASSTLAKRRIGKVQGAERPPILAYRSSRTLHRSGELAKSIAWMKDSDLTYVVGVEEGKVSAFSGGGYVTLDEIAAMQETGFTRTVPVTFRMSAYLLVLYGEITKKPTYHLPKGGFGRYITVWSPARPLWEQTFNALAGKAVEYLNLALDSMFGKP